MDALQDGLVGERMTERRANDGEDGSPTSTWWICWLSATICGFNLLHCETDKMAALQDGLVGERMTERRANDGEDGGPTSSRWIWWLSATICGFNFVFGNNRAPGMQTVLAQQIRDLHSGRREIMENSEDRQLHLLVIDKLGTAINRTHILLHSFLITVFLYYRLSLLFTHYYSNDVVFSPFLQLILLSAELILCFLWICEQGYRWRPINRTALIHNLPHHSHLPALDVFICTADPDKEPTVEVMNTVVSAMALDYPSDKLHVYLSDDSGSALTQIAMKEAWAFATWWIPFCRTYNLDCRSPMAYFEDHEHQNPTSSDEFIRDKLLIQEKYELFKQRVETNLIRQRRTTVNDNNKSNHPQIVQVINEKCSDPSIINPDYSDIPLLVYVAREKRPSYPHHFKSGALNVLLRVSALLSNSPVVLLLDCDMYCNDPTTAKQAMCFYLDPQISPSLSFVQFPQRYHNLRSNDIYDGGLRWSFKVLMQGLDGLNKGPLMCGTGFFLNRKAIYNPLKELITGADPIEPRNTLKTREISEKILHETELVASCSYEKDTNWGQGVGFYYYSIAEDVFTGYHLHIGGWKSVYVDPKKDPFLGTCTTNFNVFLDQNARWTAGLVEIGISRFCPLLYGPSRKHFSLVHRLYYTWVNLYTMDCIPVCCLAVIPQICLFHGIPIYSEVPGSLFPLLGLFIFLSSVLKHLHEVLTTEGTTLTWWNEQRTWTLKMLTCNVYGCLDATMKVMGLRETSFIPTSKVTDEEQSKRYEQGIYDFRTSNRYLVPLGTAVILNLVSFVGGLVRMIAVGNWDGMVVQLVISGFFIAMSKPIIEGMVLRKDKGRFPTSATLMSVVICFVLLVLGQYVLLH